VWTPEQVRGDAVGVVADQPLPTVPSDRIPTPKSQNEADPPIR
jgi:hypothetical protein